jgi:hypothetical protein
MNSPLYTHGWIDYTKLALVLVVTGRAYLPSAFLLARLGCAIAR